MTEPDLTSILTGLPLSVAKLLTEALKKREEERERQQRETLETARQRWTDLQSRVFHDLGDDLYRHSNLMDAEPLPYWNACAGFQQFEIVVRLPGLCPLRTEYKFDGRDWRRETVSWDVLLDSAGSYTCAHDLVQALLAAYDHRKPRDHSPCAACRGRGGWEDGDEGQWVTCSCDAGRRWEQ